MNAELQDGFWQLQARNSGVCMDAATLAAFSADAGPAHAARDPFSRMRTGLRFAAQLMRAAGGALTAAPAGAGRKGGCIVTVKLPAARTEPACEPTIVLRDGTSSVEELAQAEVLAALVRNAGEAPAQAQAEPRSVPAGQAGGRHYTLVRCWCFFVRMCTSAAYLCGVVQI